MWLFKASTISSSRLGQLGEFNTFPCSSRLWLLTQSLPRLRHRTSSMRQQNSTPLFFPARRYNFECVFLSSYYNCFTRIEKNKFDFMDIPYIFTDFLRFNKLNVRNRIQPISNTISKYFEVLGLLVHSVSM